MSLWVLGTDTDVGKTLVSTLILLRHGGDGRLAYWKPISTGGHDDRDLATVGARVPVEVPRLPETYIYDPPVSPHLAARLAGERILVDRLLEDFVRHGLEHPGWNLLIEAAGGVLVPLDDDGLPTVDLVAQTTLPAVVVARSTLGTINHTLLTLEALRARDVPIVGVVLDGPPDADNRDAIHRFGRVAIISEVPPLEDPDDADALREAAARFDPDDLLAPYLRDADS